jgi:hypothetical protein
MAKFAYNKMGLAFLVPVPGAGNFKKSGFTTAAAVIFLWYVLPKMNFPLEIKPK